MNKFLSRKFLLCMAAFLGSIGTSVAGFTSKSEMLAAFGLICATISAAIYAACEAWTDSANSTTTMITTSNNASTMTTKATNTQLSKDLIAEAQMKAESGGDQNG